MKMAMQMRKQDVRLATIGDLEGDDAYIELIRFDEELSSDYNGFQMACDQVGLPYPTLRQYESYWQQIEADNSKVSTRA